MKKLIMILFFLSLLLSPFSFAWPAFQPESARAEMFFGVPTVIAEDTVWTKEAGPYVIDFGPDAFNCNLEIASGTTLAIEAGAIVKFGFNCGFQVGGRLSAEGTAEAPVIFTALTDSESAEAGGGAWPGDWRGIDVYDSGELSLKHAIVRYGGHQALGQAKKQEKNRFARISAAQAQIADQYAVGAITAYPSARVLIEYSDITENKIGLEAKNIEEYWGDEPGEPWDILVQNSRIFGNAAAGFLNRDPKAVSAPNNWWGSALGPNHNSYSIPGADLVFGAVLYSPWRETAEPAIEPAPEQKRNPLIIVPGIMGSFLNRAGDNTEIWLNLNKMLLPGDDSYLDELILPASGVPASQGIFASDIVREIDQLYYHEDFFAGFINKLAENGYAENKNLFVFPYDWRLDLDLLANGASSSPWLMSLGGKIESVKRQASSSQVDIIAHSLGGLIVKKYIQENGQASVGKFIDLGTPHYGAPKAFKILEYGDNNGIIPLNAERVKIITQNFPSVFELLPSAKYFDRSDSDYRFYVYSNYYPEPDLDFNATSEFHRLSGRNPILLDQAALFHASIDEVAIDDAFNLAGCGLPTLGAIKIIKMFSTDKKDYKVKYISGDGTVPLRSALGLNSASQYFVERVEHAGLPAETSVQDLALAILGGESGNFDYSAHVNISQDQADCALNGIKVSVHSPLDIEVFDDVGGHIGLNEDGNLETKIPGAAYEIIDGHKFLFLPAGQDFHIFGQATDRGEFTLEIQNVVGGQEQGLARFDRIALPSISTKIKLDLEAEAGIAAAEIKIDHDGDNVPDETIQPTVLLSPAEAGDENAPATTAFFEGQSSVQANEFFGTTTLSFIASDDLSGIAKTFYSLNSTSSWAEYQAANPLEIGAVGDYTAYFYSLDRAGNEEAVKSADFSIKPKGCQALSASLIEDLYLSGGIKSLWLKNILLAKLALAEKLSVVLGKLSQCQLSFCPILEKSLLSLQKQWLEKEISFLPSQIAYWIKIGWLTPEAGAIILDNNKCLLIK